MQSPYAQRIQALMARREEEEQAAGKGVKKLKGQLELHPDSFPIQELLTTLEFGGSKTIDSLARELQISKETVATYVKYLQSQGKVIVRSGKKRKGQMFVHLVESKKRNPAIWEDDRYLYPRCSSCQILVVDNIPTHEMGCPRSWINPVTNEGYTVECTWCGSSFIPDERGIHYCSESCFKADNGLEDPWEEDLDWDEADEWDQDYY